MGGQRSSVARVLGLSAVLGVVVGAGFVGFERALHHVRHLLWVDLLGEDPNPLATIALATVGGAVLGLALMIVPGHGGAHPAEGHGVVPAAADVAFGPLVGGLVVGFVGLVAGASLGPEGAILPAAAACSILVARRARLAPVEAQLVQAAGLGALLAAMFGNPIAGVIPLMEIAGATAPSMTLLVLPSLTAAATSVLTLRVLDVAPLGRLPFVYEHFRTVDLLWAVVVGVAAGFAGLLVQRLVHLLRAVSVRTDRRAVVLTTTLGGATIGVLYAIGGTEVRFAGVPEIVELVATTDTAGVALAAVVVKIAVTAVSLAAGYRGGSIFPVAFVGGATGLTLHLLISDIPVFVAVAVGMSAAMVTALGLPATAALNAAALLQPEVLPLALLGLVAAYAVHLLGGHLATLRPAPEPTAT